MDRRNFFKSIIGLAVASVIPTQLLAETTTQFSLETAKLSRPEAFINVLDFGVIDDDKYDWSRAFQAAIDKASETEQTVYVPAGDYCFTSPTILPSGGI